VIPEHKNNATLRLKTVRGHIDAVLDMVDREVYCPDVMKQVAALQGSLEKVNRILLQNHLETCVSEAIRSGSGDAKIRELLEALRFNGSLTDFRDRADPLPVTTPATGRRAASAGRGRR
jgi:DNA-binding FrmR family transcriptional regulator